MNKDEAVNQTAENDWRRMSRQTIKMLICAHPNPRKTIWNVKGSREDVRGGTQEQRDYVQRDSETERQRERASSHYY